MDGFFSFVVVCAQVPFCTRPVYSRVLLFSFSCFGLFIKLLFIDKKKKKLSKISNTFTKHSKIAKSISKLQENSKKPFIFHNGYGKWSLKSSSSGKNMK